MKSKKNSWVPSLEPSSESQYTGRFAPSPSGPLHAGSLIAALASFLDAKANNGRWLVRMEDLDPPRESPEAAKAILTTLERFHLHWDGDVLYQSTRYPAYEAALNDLLDRKLAYACDCSRQQIQKLGGVYPGTCRTRQLTMQKGHALRCLVSDKTPGTGPIKFEDSLQGSIQQSLEKEVGDFIIKRKDTLYAYQLAVVVDDAFQDITHIIRGIDLLDSTPRQLHLQTLLGFTQPRYSHIPVIVNNLGQKLSKQHKAQPIEDNRPAQHLVQALQYLQQNPEPGLSEAEPDEIIEWAITHWAPNNLFKISQLDII